MSHASRAARGVDDPDAVAEIAAQVETAARALLTVSARAGMDLPGTVSLTQIRAVAAVEEAGPCSRCISRFVVLRSK